MGGWGCWGGFRLRRVKSVKKVVRKYLNLKGWRWGHLPKYLILQVVRYQILERKGLAGGRVRIIVNIARFVRVRFIPVRIRLRVGRSEKMFHVEHFFGSRRISAGPRLASNGRTRTRGHHEIKKIVPRGTFFRKLLFCFFRRFIQLLNRRKFHIYQQADVVHRVQKIVPRGTIF
jgi:hypothetical protein